jgi:uncharacterized membrane protein
MTSSISSFFMVITYLAIAILLYGIILFIVRKYIHKNYTQLTQPKQSELLRIWSRSLRLLRVSLIMIPLCFIIAVIILFYYETIPFIVTVPPLFIMYINLVLIYINHQWHLKELEKGLQ